MKKINIFAGHYGSGKTNLSVNYALLLKENFEDVIVCDIDTVNPYFRTKDSQDVFEKAGVTLIAPEFANSNLDIPSISVKVNRAFDDQKTYSVFDVGGDDAGAIALGQFSEKVLNTEYDMFLVINKYRFMTRNPKDILEYKKEIEMVSKIPFTGIINNSNVGEETEEKHVLDAIAYGEEVSNITGLELKYTAIEEKHYEKLHDKVKNPLKIKIYKKSTWKI